jgi:hypothetical protein
MRQRLRDRLLVHTLIARFQRRFLDYGYTLRGLEGDGLA